MVKGGVWRTKAITEHLSQISTLGRGNHCDTVPQNVDVALANGMSMLTISSSLTSTRELQPPCRRRHKHLTFRCIPNNRAEERTTFFTGKDPIHIRIPNNFSNINQLLLCYNYTISSVSFSTVVGRGINQKNDGNYLG